MGAVRPSAVGITASSVVIKSIISILESHCYTRPPETALSPRQINEGCGYYIYAHARTSAPPIYILLAVAHTAVYSHMTSPWQHIMSMCIII